MSGWPTRVMAGGSQLSDDLPRGDIYTFWLPGESSLSLNTTLNCGWLSSPALREGQKFRIFIRQTAENSEPRF